MRKQSGMEYLVLVEKPTKNAQEWISILVTATDPHAAVRAVMEDDCPLELCDWVEPGCRAWVVPWLGVTGFTWDQSWEGGENQTWDPMWQGVPRGALNLPGEPVGRWQYYCQIHDRAPGIDPRDGALTCGPSIGGAKEHGHPYGYNFVPDLEEET